MRALRHIAALWMLIAAALVSGPTLAGSPSQGIAVQAKSAAALAAAAAQTNGSAVTGLTTRMTSAEAGIGTNGTNIATNAAAITTMKGRAAYPEDQVPPAVGDGVTDDTAALQAAVATGNGRCTPGKNYKITAPLIAPGGVDLFECPGATITASFGTAYGTAVFTNDKTTDAATTFIARNLRIRGNAVVFDFRFTANSPSAGLKLILDGIDWNTNDGNRRAGTSLLVVDQADFVSVRNVAVYNADLAFMVGGSVGRRDSTQLSLANIFIGQVNSAGLIQGVDKIELSNFDLSNVNSGIDFARAVKRVALRNFHVEGIAASSYPSPSARVLAASAGYGLFFRDAQEARDVMIDGLSMIDLGGTGGTAAGGIYIGDNTNPLLQSIVIRNSTIPTTMSGSASWKPIVNRGRFKWVGCWPYTTEPSLSANGYHLLDVAVEDTCGMPMQGENLLDGNTVLSLTTTAISGGGTAPTIAEAPSTAGFAHDVTFNSAGYCLGKQLNLPQGWFTLVVQGRRTSGNVTMSVSQAGSPFAAYLPATQLYNTDGSLLTYRLPFYNPTAGQAIKVCLSSQNASGDVARISYIGLGRGLLTSPPRDRQSDIVAALPTASAGWSGRRVIVRTSGAADAISLGYQNASGNPDWKAQ